MRIRAMTTKYQWGAIGGPREISQSTPFVSKTIASAFEQSSGLKFVKRKSYGGRDKKINGFHIYGVALREVERVPNDAAAGAPDQLDD